MEGVRGEREKLSRWLFPAPALTAQAVGFINSHVDRLSEQEGQVQKRLWAVEDEVNDVQTFARIPAPWQARGPWTGRRGWPRNLHRHQTQSTLGRGA